MDTSADQVAAVLAGMSYPARRWEIIAWAEYNGASRVMLDALLQIPEHAYSWPHEIADALVASGLIASCRHRRHPRECPWHDSELNTLAS
jgi:hypothetical protein